MNQLRERFSDRALAAIAGLGAVLAIFVFLVIGAVTGPKAEDALADFLAAYEAGEYDAAAALTDGDAEAVAAALEANVTGLDGAALTAAVATVDDRGAEADATTKMSWDVPDIGAFSYENDKVTLIETDDRWLVHWSDRAVHPQLGAGERLGTVEQPPARAPILDRSQRELVALRPVFEVGVIPSEMTDIPAGVAEIAKLTEIDVADFQASVDAAKPDNFVPAITLRDDEFEPIEQEIRAIPGHEVGEREAPLAPTRDFARVLLGNVGPVTEEQLEKSEGALDADDIIGQSGLQAAFEKRLAGTPERSIVIRDAAAVPVKTLQRLRGRSGEALQTTLDLKAQLAAERALRTVGGGKGALVALEPSTGNLLAAANRPTEDGLNRALAGQYPPGSTFKVVSTAALLAGGLDPDKTVDCPATIKAGGREFRNFEGSAAGAVPFSTDFSQSCNTAFVSLAPDLAPGDLSETAEAHFGFGADYKLAVDAFSGSVPPGRDETEEAAAMIGQARILASPLVMAGVAGAVADGVWRAPRLVADDESVEGEPLPAEDTETLRTLMRSVITSGTGTTVASALGEPIGKSGTAEYGSGDPPPTHAWFIAAREDVAVAVIVEDGDSGGEVAAPIVADFLSRFAAP